MLKVVPFWRFVSLMCTLGLTGCAASSNFSRAMEDPIKLVGKASSMAGDSTMLSSMES